MTINATTRKILRLLSTTDMTKAEIAREVRVKRQRVTQVQKLRDQNPYRNFDGSKLTARREAKEWSMTKLARKAGVSTSQISRWEAGKQSPWPNMWRRVCKALGCYVQDLEKDEL